MAYTKANYGGNIVPFFSSNDTSETDEEIALKLDERFTLLDLVTLETISGGIRSVIVSGPPGVGKSFSVEKLLREYDPEGNLHNITKGTVRATGLYKLLYQYREDDNIIVFDDSDSIFSDELSLNILKAVCDTTSKRRVSWLSEGKIVDEMSGEIVPSSFEFCGSIIFITNYDFDDMIERGSKLAPHLQALISRSHYISLGMKTKRDYIIRLKQVIEGGMLHDMLDSNGIDDVINFIEENMENLRELSLRIAIKVAQFRKAYPDNFEGLCRLTCCRGN
jgi:hypothetical protein